MAAARPVPPVATCLGIARNATKATVFLIERPQGQVVRKQLGTDGPWHHRWIGRWLLRREARLLRILGPTGLVPRLIGSGDDWLETEHVAGETVSSRRQRGVSHEEAKRLREALARFHLSGFAHGDLGRRDLILTSGGGVVILDVATAVGPGWPPVLGRLLRPWARRHDRKRLAETLRKALSRREDWDAHDAAVGGP